jgi:chloride channel protein, CIC family
MRNTIMTEKIARRGVRVPGEYAADFLDQVTAGLAASRPVVTLLADDPLEAVRAWIATGGPSATHQGFPVVDGNGELVGLLTRRDLLDAQVSGDARVRDLVSRPLAVVFEDTTLREAADHMVNEGVGRLPVVSRAEPRKPVGIVARSDLLAAHRRRLDETHVAEQSLDWRKLVGRSA